VEIRPVTAGRIFGALTVIDKGLVAGETVVTDGFLALFPGAKVRVVDTGKTEAGKP
jgi:membrane fusion protein (multidrug efflux system)